MFGMKKIEKQLNSLIVVARVIGLKEVDILASQEFLGYGEYGLCFDYLITQLYEYELAIDENAYNLIEKIAVGMKLDSDSYVFMKELIGGNNLDG